MQWRHITHIAIAFIPIATEICIRLESERAFHLLDDIDSYCTDEMAAHCFRLMLLIVVVAAAAFSHRVSFDISFCGLRYLNVQIWCFKVHNLSYEIYFVLSWNTLNANVYFRNKNWCIVVAIIICFIFAGFRLSNDSTEWEYLSTVLNVLWLGTQVFLICHPVEWNWFIFDMWRTTNDTQITLRVPVSIFHFFFFSCVFFYRDSNSVRNFLSRLMAAEREDICIKCLLFVHKLFIYYHLLHQDSCNITCTHFQTRCLRRLMKLLTYALFHGIYLRTFFITWCSLFLSLFLRDLTFMWQL